ncbi:MAG: helix-turn-helix domain-containing protein [Firmicutes bacterium]|nr:helix-turn-helix domain-containing protein [Bacillota bacterium]
MKDILAEITKIRLERNWSEYELSKNSGLTQSTISSWYRKNQLPTITSLEKICSGFGITLSQFFSEGSDLISLTEEQRELLDNWSCLSQCQKRIVKDLIKNMKN